MTTGSRPGAICRPFRYSLFLFLVLLFSGAAALAQTPCLSDVDCDNGDACDGIETCDLAAVPAVCLPGVPPLCDDGDDCTADSCQPATGCVNEPAPDSETAAGVDGACHTIDDNPDLYGPDGLCGTPDDLAGDGVCDWVDNCVESYNPGQLDSDRDGAGDVCDWKPCPVPTAYLTSPIGLIALDLVTGVWQSFGDADFLELRGLALDPSLTAAYVVEAAEGRLSRIELPSGTTTALLPGLQDPWGITFAEWFGPWALVTEYSAGSVALVELPDGQVDPQRLVSGLSGPRGIAAAGELIYVVESGSGALVSLFPWGGSPTTVATGLSDPSGLAIDAAGSTAYVTERGSGELSAIDLSTGVVVPVAAGLDDPIDVALDPLGAIAYVKVGYGVVAVDLSSGAPTDFSVPLGPPAPGIAVGGVAPVELRVPSANLAGTGATLTIPVEIRNPGGPEILSTDFTLGYDSTVLRLDGISAGSLTTGCTLTDNLNLPGRAVVSIFCTAPIAGNGSIAQLEFTVLGAEASGTAIRFLASLLNEGSPWACTADGGLEVPVRILGRAVYYRDAATGTEPGSAPVPAALADISYSMDPMEPDAPFASVPTGCDGTFAVAVPPRRQELLALRKTGDFGGAIDPFDAALNAQHVVGLTTLSPAQQIAADVTGNGSLTSFDSARIAQLAVGILTQFEPAGWLGGDWVFLPVPQSEPNQTVYQPSITQGEQSYNGSIAFSPIIESAENQDFRAILLGDVSGNWQPPVCGPAAPGLQAVAAGPTVAAEPTARLDLPRLVAASGDRIRVAVRATGTAGSLSFNLDLRFDPDVLSLVGAESGPATTGFTIVSNLRDPGRARLALFRPTPLTADGDVAVVTFDVIGRAGAHTALWLESPRVNEGRIPVGVHRGSVRVRASHPRR